MTDAFWQRVEPLVPQRVPSPDKKYLRKPGAGRPPKPARQVFEAIVYVLRTGCQWKALPKERFGSASAVHKRFLEWEEVYTDHYYGTLKSEIERIWNKGHHVIFDVDVHGGLNLKKIFGERALAVFVKAPSIQHLENRLKLRETETPESIARRISKAEQEIKLAPDFDKIVLNDKMEHAFEQAEELVSEFLTKR